MLFASGVVYAGADLSEINVVADITNQKISVDGTLPDSKGKFIFLTVLSPDVQGEKVSLSEDVSIQEFSSKVFHIAQISLDTDSKFFYEISMDDTTSQGWYSVYVTADGINRQEKKFFYTDENIIRQAILDLNTATLNDFSRLLNDVGVEKGNDYLPVEQDVFSIFCVIRDENGVFDDQGIINEEVEKIKETFTQAKALANINAANKDSVQGILETYAQSLNIDENDEAYKKVKDSIGEIFTAVRDGESIKIDSLTDFTNVFEKSIALCVLNAANRTEFHDVLVKYNYVFGLSLDGIYSKVNKLDVAKELAFSGFTGIAQLKQKFNTVVAQLYESQNNKPQNPTGGGGGGGGGGTIHTIEKDNVTSPQTPITTQPENTNVFADLDTVEWAKESILDFAQKGIINGVDGENFMPNNNVTREEFVKIMVIAFGLEDTEISIQNPFNDVTQEDWYYRYVSIANQLEIINGVTQDSLGVGLNLTRQDLAVIAYRAVKASGIELEINISDKLFADHEDISDYAREAVNSLYSAGVINGVGDNKFSPKEFATRAQAVKIMYDVINFLK